jgi:hypothetical protein
MDARVLKQIEQRKQQQKDKNPDGEVAEIRIHKRS